MTEKISPEYKDASDRLVCAAKKDINYDQFAKIAEQLSKQFKGKILEKVDDGFSQRYWDVSIDNTKVCFHFDDMICDFEIISLEGIKSDELTKKLANALV